METLSEIIVGMDGTVRYIHDDNLAGIIDPGKVLAQRASHVEPESDGSGWFVDLSPVGGPRLDGFSKRQEALDAEVAWLYDHNIPVPKALG